MNYTLPDSPPTIRLSLDDAILMVRNDIEKMGLIYASVVGPLDGETYKEQLSVALTMLVDAAKMLSDAHKSLDKLCNGGTVADFTINELLRFRYLANACKANWEERERLILAEAESLAGEE